MTEQRHELALRRQPVEVARARRHIAQVFNDVDTDTRETLQVLTSEVVTNAIRHGGDDIVLSTILTSGEARIEVLDTSPETPQLGSPTSDAESGRGLVLLDALARAWGVRRVPGRSGKVVWFTLPV